MTENVIDKVFSIPGNEPYIETAEKYMWSSESIRTWISAIKSKHE